MNHIYRVVWNATTGVWQAASELQRGRCKSASARRTRRAAAAVLAAIALPSLAADILPTGATILSGVGAIARDGTRMTINQTSSKLAVDWRNFSIGPGNSVEFIQPSSSAVALNRVTGSEVSHIQGSLKANGQVFLLNPNGVLFSPTAQVNVGALIASTLDMRQDDFDAGRYRLTGNNGNAVINQGNLHGAAGGGIALVAARVSNNGNLDAERGSVLLGAGSDVLVDFGGAVKLAVNRGAVDALVDNGGAIRADGGTVIMKAAAAGELASTVINNSGVVQARTLATGQKGQILLLGDMANGRIDIQGTLDASAPKGGDGGFIETSAAHVATSRLSVNAGAAPGRVGGEWLIDPYDYTINATAAGNITAALNTGTSVTVTTASNTAGYGATASGSGDITVASAISKTAGGDASLTLRADRNIVVNSAISSSAGKLNLTLSSANAAGATVGGVDINADLSTNGGKLLIGGGSGAVTNGIGYALNLNNSSPAVAIEQNRTLLTNGGNITINGVSTVGSSSGSLSGTTGGVYVKSGATILSGLGNMVVNADSRGGIKTFGFAVEGNSGTLTTLGSGTNGGSMQLNAYNTTAGATQANLDQGAIGLVAYGSRARVYLQGPSVASWLVFVNGVAQLSAYTQSPQLAGCATPYPNCGTIVIPGSNNSYLYATYQSVSMATQAMYAIKSGNGSKVYDGSTTATGLTVTSLGGPSGFNVSSFNPALVFNTDSKNAGVYDSVSAAASNPTSYTSGGTTYAVGYFGTGTYTITPKTLTPLATSRQYDGTTTAAVSASGLIAGDVATLSGNGSFASPNVGSYNVSVTGITLGGADAVNYTLAATSASAPASITPRILTVSASKVYDGSNALSTVTLGNLVAGETLGASGATANSAHVGTASFIDALTLGNGSGLASNYQLPSLASASASNTAAITPKSLTVTGLSAANKTYDGNTAATLTGGTLAGLISGETLNLLGLSGSFADANAGAGKTVNTGSVSLGNGSGLASDYTVATPAGLTADIARRALTVSGIGASDKTYDGNTFASVSTAGALLNNLVNGETVGLTASGSFADANAGTGKTINLSTGMTGSAAANYTLGGQSTATASITPRNLTVSASKVYDGSNALPTVALSNLVAGETLGVSGTTANSAHVGSASFITALTLSNGSGLASNYQLPSLAGASASNTAAITPKSLTVSGLTAVNKTYDGSTAAILTGGSLSGLAGGETLNFLGLSGSFADANAGAGKTVSLGSVSLGNGSGLASDYTVATPVGLTADITRRALTVSGISANDKIYDRTTLATVSTAAAQLSNLVGGDTVGLTASGAFVDANAGVSKTVNLNMALTGTAASNYTLGGQSTATASIARKAITLAGVTAADKIYDGNVSALLSGGALSGLVGGETLVVSGMQGAFADKNAGINKSVAISGATLADGTGLASNYLLSQPASVSASIARKTLNVTGTTIADKTADGSTAAQLLNAGALFGAVPGDLLTLNSASAQANFAQAAAGTNIAVNVTGFGLTGTDAGNYTVSGNVSAIGNIIAAVAPPVQSPVVTLPVVTPVVTPPVVTPELISPAVTPIVTPMVPPAVTPPVVVPVVTPLPTPVTAPVVTPLVPPVVTPVVTPTGTPVVTPASLPPVSAPVPSDGAADAARYAAVLPVLPAAAVGSMGYLAVPEAPGSATASAPSAATPAFADSHTKQPASQGASANRDVKFLSVFVVGGGIQLPALQMRDSAAPNNDTNN